MIQNEPIAALRHLDIFLVDGTGAGKAGQSRAGGSTVQIRKTGGAWVDSSADLTDRSFGAYELPLTAGELDTVGPIWVRVVNAGVFRDFYDVVMVEPARDCTFYGLAAGGGTTFVTLPSSAVATDNWYAGGGQDCVVAILGGVGTGQMRLGTAYAGASTKHLSITPVWISGSEPDATSVIKIFPYVGQLDAATIATILADARFAHLDANVSSRLMPVVGGHEAVLVDAAGHVGPDWAQIGTPGSTVNLSATTLFALSTTERAAVAAAMWDLAISGHHSTGSFGELLQVVAGLLHMHGRIDNTVFSAQGILTFGRLRCFASAAAAAAAVDGHADGTDSELFRFTITSTDNGDGTYSNFKVVRNL